ncbi:hypothetical protein QR680_015936 [Steinernema hermaphroditum]|uniref:Ubiquitin-like protease family profile domain-containing protein n=1 Tax=Steinernema hermaphroditum TaxID=289476 RepID=A0AA39LLR2_9BILA|nr:hypothetical protein QR680_015936 [Steinernema hermaphroditum]
MPTASSIQSNSSIQEINNKSRHGHTAVLHPAAYNPAMDCADDTIPELVYLHRDAYTTVLMPIHNRGPKNDGTDDHWALAVADLESGSAVLYDSAPGVTELNAGYVVERTQQIVGALRRHRYRDQPFEDDDVEVHDGREFCTMQKDAYNCGIHTMYNAIYFAEQLHRDSHPGPGAYDLRMPEGTDINELRPIIKAELLEHLAPELDHTPEMDNSDEDEVIELRPRTVQQLAPVLERLALESEHVDENEPLQLPAGMAPDVEMAVLNKAPHFPPEFEQLEEELKQLTPDVEVDDDLYELPPELKAKILGPDWQQRSVPKGKRARPPDVQLRVIPADPAHFERIERELLDHSDDDDDVFEDCHQ